MNCQRGWGGVYLPEKVRGEKHPGLVEASLPPPSILTRNFILAWLVSFSAFASFYFLLATLPLYIVQIGGSESEVGLIIGVFATTALALRPLVGRAADIWSRRLLILGGSFLLFLSSLSYNLAQGVFPLLLVRVLHGAGWAGFGTAVMVLVADLLPPPRRGEGMGYYGMSMNLAMALGPAAGVFLLRAFSFPVLFLSSAAMAMVGVVLAGFISEPHRQKNPSRGAILERSALFPSLVLCLSALSYGSIVSFFPLYAGKKGIENPGLFFTVFALVLILARGPAGRLSDKKGRAATIVPGLLLAALGLSLLSVAGSLGLFLLAALLYGLSFALVQPSLMALTIDRAEPSRRGAAMGTFSMAMDLGIGGGAFLWGFVAQGAGFPAIYQLAAITTLVALVVFLLGRRSRRAFTLT